MWSSAEINTSVLAAIFSLSGPELTDREKALFRESNPLGFILFARNCADPDQLRKLTDDLKDALGRDCPVLIDQEGGRVQRLKPPHWSAYPPMRDFADQPYEALESAIRAQAGELTDAGINVNCAPVLDVLTPETHDVIGDRAFSHNPEIVSELGGIVCEALLGAGITPVIKHMPGHGRATADSHHVLPRVRAARGELEKDFAPFRDIAGRFGHKVWAMTAHVVYDEIDMYLPTTLSRKAISGVIRRDIGFDGFLISDDMEMKALASYGDVAENARVALNAGLDCVLHCNGDFKEMERLADALPKLRMDSVKRLQNTGKSSKVAS